jgi:CysZ protein
MLDVAVKALSQILSPPMRSILWRSIGLALVLIVVLAIGLQRLLSWFAVSGEVWAEAMLGPNFHTLLNVVAWIVSIAAGFGVVFGAVFLMPAITSLVASVLVDDVADHVEREHYPAERPGTALPYGLAMTEGVKTALLTILVYLIALPFVFVAGAGFIAFFIATAWLLGREYFELAAMRFRPPAEAKAMRKQNAALVFTAGLVIAAFVSIPIVNLATPLFGMAFMVHMHKRLSGPRPEVFDPSRKTSVPVCCPHGEERVFARLEPGGPSFETPRNSAAPQDEVARVDMRSARATSARIRTAASAPVRHRTAQA